MKAEELIKNIGKRCIIKESVIAELAGKEGTILSLVGNEEKGFSYEVHPYISPMNRIYYFYIPIFLCEILPDNLVTKQYLDNIPKTDIGFIRSMPNNPILCENKGVFNSVLKYFQQLHIGTSSNKENLTIIA